MLSEFSLFCSLVFVNTLWIFICFWWRFWNSGWVAVVGAIGLVGVKGVVVFIGLVGVIGVVVLEERSGWSTGC